MQSLWGVSLLLNTAEVILAWGYLNWMYGPSVNCNGSGCSGSW